MARASDGHAVGGGVSATRVTLRAEWRAIIEEAQAQGSPMGAPRRMFTPEEDALILEGRAAGVTWAVLGKALRCHENTARRRLVELREAAKGEEAST